MENIKHYINEAYRIASQHGFHQEKRTKEHWLMLVMCEISEAVEADRKGNHYNGVEDFEEREHVWPDFNERYEQYVKGSVAEELADAFIRLCDYAGEYTLLPIDSPRKDLREEWESILVISHSHTQHILCAISLHLIILQILKCWVCLSRLLSVGLISSTSI